MLRAVLFASCSVTLFNTTQQHVSKDMMYFLPRNTQPDEVATLLNDDVSYCEMEHNYLDGRFKTVTMYTGALARPPPPSQTTASSAAASASASASASAILNSAPDANTSE
jgi:hypothetical protein